MDDSEIHAWLDAAPKSVKDCFFGNILFVNFWHEQRNKNFQMQGMNDGSISDGCRESFKSNQAVCNAIIQYMNQHPDSIL